MHEHHNGQGMREEVCIRDGEAKVEDDEELTLDLSDIALAKDTGA